MRVDRGSEAEVHTADPALLYGPLSRLAATSVSRLPLSGRLPGGAVWQEAFMGAS